MKFIHAVTAFGATILVNSAAIAEWQWSNLPGLDKGRNIPQIERDIAKINSFEQVRKNWKTTSVLNQSLCEEGVSLSVIEEFPAGKQRVFPKKGQTLAWALSSARGHQTRKPGEEPTARSTTITVIDVDTKEVVTAHELPIQFNGGIHDTIMSPDGRYLFAAGPHLSDYLALKAGDRAKMGMLESFTVGGQNFQGEFYALLGTPENGKGQSTMIKIDAMTLEPVALIDFIGSTHHGSGMGKNYGNGNMMWIDVFQEDPDGASAIIFDPDTLEIECAMKDESIGKGKFWTQINSTPHSNYIMLQVTPVEPYVGGATVSMGDPLYLPPNYIAVVDAKSKAVVRELPVPPQAGGFTITDSKEQFMYNVSGGTDQLFKQDFKTGELIWSARTGMGPYGISINLDHSEIWVADKGETVEYWGNSITVINNQTGQIKSRIQLPGYGVDHVIMAPNGKEVWATSNASGQIYVIDTATKEVTNNINMDGRGSTHGAVFVKFEDGKTPLFLQDSHEYIERTPHLKTAFRSYPAVQMTTSGSVEAAKVSDPMEKGRILFQAMDGCHICHKPDGSGVIGPDIRGKGFDSIKNAITSRRDMVNWQSTRKMTDEELQAIGKWLETKTPAPKPADKPADKPM
jgi:YVTN family beta-propeller protein